MGSLTNVFSSFRNETDKTQLRNYPNQLSSFITELHIVLNLSAKQWQNPQEAGAAHQKIMFSLSSELLKMCHQLRHTNNEFINGNSCFYRTPQTVLVINRRSNDTLKLILVGANQVDIQFKYDQVCENTVCCIIHNGKRKILLYQRLNILQSKQKCKKYRKKRWSIRDLNVVRVE